MDDKAEIEGRALEILIIDDDVTCVRLLSHLLKRSSRHQVQAANGGLEAVQLVSAQQFDIILCDLNMPGWDGVEIIRLLAQRGSQAGLILVSASDARVMESARQLAVHRGLHVIGCLTKPIVQREVDKLLTKASALRDIVSARSVQQPMKASELATAVAEGQLRLHFQPQVSLSDGRHLCSEALVRWEHPTRGLLYPDAFIFLAEGGELIEPLTDWVVSAAIAQARRWQHQGLPFDIAVNISAHSLKRLDLPDRLAERVASAGLEPHSLTLEVTESGLHNDIEALLDIATRLRLKGFPLSIDDFGTGYANLTQLRRLPFTELKLDRSFVSGATLNNDSGVVVRSSVELAQRLRLRTVGEGIEGLYDWQLLRSLGVDRGQGFYIARPMPATDFPGWLALWEARRHTHIRESVDSIPTVSA